MSGTALNVVTFRSKQEYKSYILGQSQWALEPQIDVNSWSISGNSVNRLGFDILQMSNCKYIDINAWVHNDDKNVSRK